MQYTQRLFVLEENQTFAWKEYEKRKNQIHKRRQKRDESSIKDVRDDSLYSRKSKNLGEYSSTNGSGRCTDEQHNEAKEVAIDIMERFKSIQELDKIELEYAIKAWKYAKDFAEQTNAERDFVYWDDIEKIVKRQIKDEDEAEILLSELEQKCNLIRNKNREKA